MLSKSKRSPAGVGPSRGSQSRMPRTMPVTQPEALDFSVSTMAETPNSNFSLTSSCSGSRRLNSVNSDLVPCNNYPGSSGDDYFLSTPSSMSYIPISSGATFSGPLMPTMGSLELDPTPYDFLVDHVVSTSTSTDMNFVSLPYNGQVSSQDILTSFVDVSMCGPAVMNNWSGPEGYNWSPLGRPDTPPPEDYIQEFLPQHFSPPQDIQDDSCTGEQDFTIYDVNDISKSSSHRSDCSKPYALVSTNLASSRSIGSRHIAQPRPIRSASERSDSLDDTVTSIETRISKDDQVDKVKARSHPLYEAKPQEDGKFHCPMKSKSGCNHEPTGQRCIYK